MTQELRIGSQIGPYDPFWVQVREAVNQKAQQLGLELIPIEIAGRPDTLSPTEQISVVEELLFQQLDALIGWNFPESMLQPMLERGLPIIYLWYTGLTSVTTFVIFFYRFYIYSSYNLILKIV